MLQPRVLLLIAGAALEKLMSVSLSSDSEDVSISDSDPIDLISFYKVSVCV